MAVNWNDPIRTSRIKGGKPYSEWRYPATCNLCGSTRLLKKVDAQQIEEGGAICGRCSRKANASKGYEATKAKYGEAFAAKMIQPYRLAHPSSLELQIMSNLEALNLSYQREVIVCDRWLVDFVVDGALVIEVDGEYAHSMRDANKEAQRRNQIEECGYPLLQIREADMPHASLLISMFVLEASNVRSDVA